MPEFDLPGHNMSLVKLYPSMRDPEDQSYEVSVQGYSEKHVKPCYARYSFDFRKVIDDLCKVFPGEYIHLGADEIAPEAWSKSPKLMLLRLNIISKIVKM